MASEKFAPFIGDERSNQKYGFRQHLTYSCGCNVLTKYYSDFNPKHENSMPNEQKKKCFCLNDENEPVIYKKGANLLFQKPNHFFVPAQFIPEAVFNFKIFIFLILFKKYLKFF